MWCMVASFVHTPVREQTYCDISFSTWTIKLSQTTSTLRDGEDHLARAYTLKASQCVPTSEPMHILISGIFFCESRSLFSRSCFLCRFGMMFVMPTVRISLATLESSPGCNDSRKDVGSSSASRVASHLANFPERIKLCLLEAAGLRFVGLPN